jgi:hypothetical protein
MALISNPPATQEFKETINKSSTKIARSINWLPVSYQLKLEFEMRTSIRILILTLCLAATHQGANLAHAAGKGSGGGNGDAAFALQHMAAANPGLSEEEILIKAFKESEGRIPVLNFTPFNSSEYGYERAIFLPSNEASSSYLIQLPLEGVEARDLKRDSDRYVPYFYATRKVINAGPLLGSRNPSPVWLDFRARTQFRSSTGLVFGDANDNSPTVEFRQFNPKIVVYVYYPDKDGDCVGVMTAAGKVTRRALTPYCAVGYAWAAPTP